MYDAC